MFATAKDAYVAWKYAMKMEYRRLQQERQIGNQIIDNTAVEL